MINLNYFEIASMLEGEIEGSFDGNINRLAPIENAASGDLTFFYDTKYQEFFENSNASCIIISNQLQKLPKPNQVYIKVDKPYIRFVQLLKKLDSQQKVQKSGIHKTAIIGDNCEIANSAFIGPRCIIGDNCKIAENAIINSASVIDDNSEIGENTILYPNVSIYKDVKIGNNCIIHSGAVIGSDGFGYVENTVDGSYDKIPQLGNVVIEDYVEIGANTTIDRALVGSTIIGKGTKIDNLVQIGHNCEIGENNGIASQVGISGSVTTGSRNRFGGQSGLAGHLTTTENVTILAQSGVSKSISSSGVYFGSPAKEHLNAFRIEAVIRKLPELSSNVDRIIKTLSNLENLEKK